MRRLVRREEAGIAVEKWHEPQLPNTASKSRNISRFCRTLSKTKSFYALNGNGFWCSVKGSKQ